jgi:methylenetetrahydrofolate reductase (NADPH)
LLPVLAFDQIQRIASMCGTRLPEELVRELQSAGDNQEAQREIGIAFSIKQVEALLEAGIPGLHFYVLNRSEAVEQVLRAVSLPGR